MPGRLFRKAVQQTRSERRGESYSGPYVEPLSDARTPLADFVNSLLGEITICGVTDRDLHTCHSQALEQVE
jgi:hypothetical protein